MTIEQILSELLAPQEPNLFDHAYSELSHESLIAYALDCYEKQLFGTPSDYMAAEFGKELVRRCLNNSSEEIQSLEVFRQKALRPNGKDRIDLMIQVSTESKNSLWSIIETKLDADGDQKQIDEYRSAVREFPEFKESGGTLESIALYKTGDYYNEIESTDVILILRNTICDILDGVCAAKPEYIMGQYARWIRRLCLRDTLIQHPEFQSWFYAKKTATPHSHSFQEWLNQQWEPAIQRAVQWEVMKRLATSISCDISQFSSDKNTRKGDDSAWTQLRILELDCGKEKPLAFYRLDSGQLDYRIYAGPPRGQPGEDSGHWIRVKKDVLGALSARHHEFSANLPVEFPGHRDYRFNQSSTETSICRISLEKQSLNDVVTEFPKLHQAIWDVMRDREISGGDWAPVFLYKGIHNT